MKFSDFLLQLLMSGQQQMCFLDNGRPFLSDEVDVFWI